MSSFAWRERRLEELLVAHRAAAAEFAERAAAIADARWFVPRGEGKWTPAQETRHLVLAYDGFMADLRDEWRTPMKGNAFQRAIWSAYGLPHILWRGRIPRAVRAPREYRPADERAPRGELVAVYRQRCGEFCALFADKWRGEPRRKLQHPWFGKLNLDHAMRLATVHTRHHAAFLAQSAR